MIKQPVIDSDTRATMAAMRRAGQRAIRVAKETNTPLIVERDGKIVEVNVRRNRPRKDARKKRR